MWPRRKIFFLVPQGIPEAQGIVSLLNALHIDVIVRETSEVVPADLTGLAFHGLEGDLEELSDGEPTEILYWPGIHEDNEYRQWGYAHGLSQRELPEFLHNYWEEEIILPVDSKVQFEGVPLLFKLLEAADFEPSLLWKEGEGHWVAQIGQGLYWVVLKEWLEVCGSSKSFGRVPMKIFSECHWLLREEGVDFYQGQDSFSFLGSLKRHHDSSVEKEIYDTVLQALELGVPWSEIQMVFSRIMKNPAEEIPSQETKIRWVVDDTGRGERPGRNQLSPKEFEYVENRGIG